MKSLTLRGLLLFLVLSLLPSCTVYTEKQTEALSVAVYATKDSIDSARIDLADKYATEATRLVSPPKHRVVIESVYEKTITARKAAVSEKTKPSSMEGIVKDELPISSQRVVVVPMQYKSDKVIVVSSNEYNELLKSKEIAEQLKRDGENLASTKHEIDLELNKQYEYKNKMVADLNGLQRQIAEMNLALLRRNIIIATMIGAIVLTVYLRMKKLIFL